MKVTWKPIPHDSKINIDDVDRGINGVSEKKKDEAMIRGE